MTIFPVFVALVLCYDNNMKSIWKLTNRMLLVAVAILLAAILVTPPSDPFCSLPPMPRASSR